MTIINIIGSLDKSMGGPSRSVPQICKEVSTLGLHVKLIARPSSDPVSIKESNCFQVINKSFFQLIFFFTLFSKKKISLIHLQHVWDPYIHLVAFIARIKNIPYLVTTRGMMHPSIMNKSPFKKRAGMFFYQRNDIMKAVCIHVSSKEEKEDIRKLGFLNPIKIIPNGLNINEFPSLTPTKVKTPKKILFLSRIHPQKGVETLILAWSKIENTLRQNWIVEIVGNGNQKYIKELKKKIIELNLEHQLIIKPPVYGTEKINLYRESFLFVLPSISESFGMVVAEALSSFTPVITTKGTPWQELETENCGWWINLSIGNLQNALKEAMQKSEYDLICMGKNGRKLIEEKYDIKMVSEKMKDLYNSVLNDNISLKNN